MKLRYYMRGLGIGIIVTALIMGIAAGDARPLTDAEIKAAAQKLGMVESDSLKLTDIQQASQESESSQESVDAQREDSQEAEDSQGGEDSQEARDAQDGEDSQEAGDSQDGEDGQAAGDSQDGEDGQEDGDSQEAGDFQGGGESREDEGNQESQEGGSGQASPENGGTVTVTIQFGSGSRTVCNQLEEAGLIEDAAAFDQYLITNGYSKRICAGTYEIEAGTDEEQIAKIISGSR